MKHATIDELIDDLLGYYRSQGMDGAATIAAAKWKTYLQPVFGKTLAKDLTTAAMRNYRGARLQAGAQQSTINRDLMVLRKAFTLAVECEPPKVARAPKFEFAKENNARMVFFTICEVNTLRAEADKVGPWLRAIVEMGYAFGWRRSEIVNLPARNIHLRDKTVRLDRTKNGDARTALMTPELYTLVRGLLAGKEPCDRLFPPMSTFLREWRKLVKAAGVPDKHFHDFRRTSARDKRAAGVDPTVIMEIQGWRTVQMFKRYAITNLADQADAQAKLAEWAEKQNSA